MEYNTTVILPSECQISKLALALRLASLIVKVRVAAVLREVGVCERAAGAVEGVAVAVLLPLEADLDVHAARRLRTEVQVRLHLPQLERLQDLVVDL